MNNRLARLFVKSAGVLLLITAAAKIFSSITGKTPIFNQHDPILWIPFRIELTGVAILEIIIASVCFFTDRIRLQLGLLAWLASSYAAYRFALWLSGIQFCKCLGNIPDTLHLSEHTANTITFAILTYLLAGSYAGLIAKWAANSARS